MVVINEVYATHVKPLDRCEQLAETQNYQTTILLLLHEKKIHVRAQAKQASDSVNWIVISE